MRYLATVIVLLFVTSAAVHILLSDCPRSLRAAMIGNARRKRIGAGKRLSIDDRTPPLSKQH